MRWLSILRETEMESKTGLLSSLSEDQLWNEFLNSPFPKWGSLCLLKYLEMPVLDAAYVHPKASKDEVLQIIGKFTHLYNIENLLIRSDGGRESGRYIRGGNSLKINNALALINTIQSNNRAVILMRPTNRFTNKLALNFHLDHSGIFRLEALGPGFDVGDLNRGLLSPEISIVVNNVDWLNYDLINPFYTSIRISPIERIRELRLQRIGEELLPAIGITSNNPPALLAKQWLEQNGYNAIFLDQRPNIEFWKIQKFFNIAFIVGSFYRCKVQWDNLVISASDLGDKNDLVFWDISNPKEKFITFNN
jgi:hypothetical protein